MREKWLREHPRIIDLDIDPMDWAATALEAAEPFVVAAEHERCARLTRSESFRALLATINRIAGQVDLPLDTAAELLTAISAYAQPGGTRNERKEIG
jgi:hypothetical protein